MARLLNLRDCADCSNSIITGRRTDPDVHCNSQSNKAKLLFKADGRQSAAYCPEFKEHKRLRAGQIELEKALEYMLAGKAEFLCKSLKQEELEYVFRLERKKDDLYYVLLPDRKDEYAGHVCLDKSTDRWKFVKGNKGNLDEDDVIAKSLAFILNDLYHEKYTSRLKVFHMGKCGCCGVSLEDPIDIESGLCAKCYKNSKPKEKQ